MIPTILNDWTYEVITDLTVNGQNESNIHDFKKDLPETETLTKLCCAFANTNGGFIVIGVTEVNGHWSICGIENSLEVAHRFGQKLKANPTINFSLPKVISIPNCQKIIAVIEIPKSFNGPHVPDISPEKRIFFKRTNKGNDFMTYEEIKYKFSNYYEKLEKLKLLQIEIENNIDICNEIIASSPEDGTQYSLLSFEDQSFKLLITDTFPLFSDNVELMNKLHIIKRNMLILENELKIFMQKICLPTTDRRYVVRHHNMLVTNNIKFIEPIFIDVLSELKKIIEI